MVTRRFALITLAVVATGYLVGCGKKQQALEEMQEPMSMEALTALNATTQAMPESQAQLSQGVPVPLPPSGPYKPTAQEIQTALKNAGYYAGLIDGKIGPLTKKAIEGFQKANGLKDDGKVGPKTWAVLSAYMNPPAKSQLEKKP